MRATSYASQGPDLVFRDFAMLELNNEN